MTWNDFLRPYQTDSPALFSDALMQRWGQQPWAPDDDDRKAAGKLHIQIASRITTQRLGYLDGVEKTALDSVFALFQKTRDIGTEYPLARHFDALAWDVLNTHVRPFTAKWHRESERGALAALDATDEFRARLTALQPVLRKFDGLLLDLRDATPAPAPAPGGSGEADDIAGEMNAAFESRIPPDFGGIEPRQAAAINEAEWTAIERRRRHYDIPIDKTHTVALALSGGGIRSATFSLGVLVALAGRNILPQFDYLSTVSGGGYLGAFLSAFLQSTHFAIGLGADQLPFRREEGEAAALRHIRHHSKYLATGSPWQRFTMIVAQLYGMLLNGLAVAWLCTIVAVVERWARFSSNGIALVEDVTLVLLAALGVGVVGALVVSRVRNRLQPYADVFVAVPAVVLGVVLAWRGLGDLHAWYGGLSPTGLQWSLGDKETWVAIAGIVPAILSMFTGLIGRLRKGVSVSLMVLATIAAPVFLVGLYLTIYQWLDSSVGTATLDVAGTRVPLLWLALGGAGLVYLFLFDINFTSPHRHYRRKLAEAYVTQPRSTPTGPFDTNVPIPLSSLGSATARAPYHLINCALNVPSSANPGMQGRLTDFFLFSQAYSGSPLIGYRETSSWERADPRLDLGTAMAVSGAAAAPQMGLGTMKRFSFWLALLNVRLGYWARRPDAAGWSVGAPGLRYLLREMLGTMDERSHWVNLSDGGHIENLGVYELLRRRCKYIVAIDGEEDSKMTFHALTTLQRLAAIDLGVRIDIDLDDLRLNAQGLSRSHFRFCRIRYPRKGRGSEDQFGYLLYLKLSLTGNEGEFIRRFHLDEPAFPHHSTADQFFSEAQFEAYRSLGEHVGDKLFLRAIVGDNMADSRSVNVEAWFNELGKNLLAP